jgi:hypothetical protein
MKKYLSIAAALIVMVGVVATTGTAGTSSEEPCEPQDAWTETTGWVLESPGAGWYQVDEKTVTDQEATEDAWTNQVWHVYAGNNNSDDAPSLNDSHWQATGGGPQSENHAFENHTPDVPYSVDRANGRGSDWFLWTATFVSGQDLVTHQEFKFALDHPAVDCPGEELVETSASVEPLQPSCEKAGEIGLLLGNEDAVDYSIEGDIAPGSTVSVTASAKAGFELMGDDEWEITFDSSDPSSCEKDPDDPIPGSGEKPTLTSSGSGSGSSSSSSSSGPQVKAATTSDAPTGSTLPFSL